jgi:2-polyprenyl-3-methyl-5-hydroxy-6-metoxy-1,4-benzoquinol methylase
VLDLGCGTGIPNSKILIDEGMTVYGIDASPTMVRLSNRIFQIALFCAKQQRNLHF